RAGPGRRGGGGLLDEGGPAPHHRGDEPAEPVDRVHRQWPLRRDRLAEEPYQPRRRSGEDGGRRGHQAHLHGRGRIRHCGRGPYAARGERHPLCAAAGEADRAARLQAQFRSVIYPRSVPPGLAGLMLREASATSLRQALLSPRSVAIIGQSDDAAKTAGRPLSYLRQAGYAGAVYAINPRRATVLGERAWASLGELPEVPDHAYIV